MALLAHSQSSSLGHSLNGRIQALRLRFERFVEARRERARLVRELETYSDEELGELGLSRLDIPAVAAGSYRR
ncbi:DUF1127 domain-containing protein [Acidisoma sp. C75]